MPNIIAWYTIEGKGDAPPSSSTGQALPSLHFSWFSNRPADFVGVLRTLELAPVRVRLYKAVRTRDTPLSGEQLTPGSIKRVTCIRNMGTMNCLPRPYEDLSSSWTKGRKRLMAKQCTHLNQIREVTPSANGCEECLKTGDSWVHLRLCLTCGHVGCCDSSKNKHATKHFHATNHPIIQSFQPGEDWVWCYIDQVMLEPA
jgi:hypothetical protein